MRWNADKQIICPECKEHPATVKYNGLCTRCNFKSWGKGRNLETHEIQISDPTEKKYQHKAEMVFAQLHPTFLYQPAIFYLGIKKYIPDFYDPIHNIFFEVIGSRQRFEQLKNKIKAFRELFPNIKLQLCCGDGRPYHSTKNPEIVGQPQTEMFS